MVINIMVINIMVINNLRYSVFYNVKLLLTNHRLMCSLQVNVKVVLQNSGPIRVDITVAPHGGYDTSLNHCLCERSFFFNYLRIRKKVYGY